VTTDEHGTRNSLNNQRSLPNVLTVGDGFVFGDQVNDGDTWQSCLNSKTETHNFINAGVAGYGTAQPVLRAKSLLNIYNPEKNNYLNSCRIQFDERSIRHKRRIC